MSMYYTDPKREGDPTALPDVEIFRIPEDYNPELEDGEDRRENGWYYWECLPGCLPSGEPNGPFESEEKALEDVRETAGIWDQ